MKQAAKETRSIIVKVAMRPTDYVAFRDVCQSAGKSQSAVLNDKAIEWTADENHKRRRRKNEWSIPGQNRAMFLPGRVNYGATKMHMRM